MMLTFNVVPLRVLRKYSQFKYKGGLAFCNQTFFSTKGSELIPNSLPDFAKFVVEKCKNILLMVGAGLSTPSGIPDFRSPGTGLYYNLKQYNLPYPEAIFELHYFRKDPRPFITLAQELYPGAKYRPNLGHYFARLLNEKGKLLRMYTQNIDGLERLAGIPPEKLVEAHGGFYTASCIDCYTKHDPEKTRSTILNGEIMYCEKRKCKGLVKPDIVFFGEALPSRFFFYYDDVLLADCLIVIGTSLEVYPFASVADEVPSSVPRLLINRDVVGSFGTRNNDVILQSDIIEGVNEFAAKLGWKEDLKELYEKYEK